MADGEEHASAGDLEKRLKDKLEATHLVRGIHQTDYESDMSGVGLLQMVWTLAYHSLSMYRNLIANSADKSLHLCRK